MQIPFETLLKFNDAANNAIINAAIEAGVVVARSQVDELASPDFIYYDAWDELRPLDEGENWIKDELAIGTVELIQRYKRLPSKFVTLNSENEVVWFDTKEEAQKAAAELKQKAEVRLSTYPEKVCHDCGTEAVGSYKATHTSTYHEARCDVCGEVKGVTQPRDFGYPIFKTAGE